MLDKIKNLFKLPENAADRRPFLAMVSLYAGLAYALAIEVGFPILNEIFTWGLPTVASEFLLGLLILPVIHWATSRGMEKIKNV